MEGKIAIARRAALQLFTDVIDVQYASTLKTGEEKFTARRQGKAGQLTITLNPNGTKAAVEWKGSSTRGRLNSKGTDYRVFRVDDYPTTDESVTSATNSQ
jgi:hypothetical protein